MSLKVLVAENIPATREAICQRLNEHAEIEVVAYFSTVTDTIQYLLNEDNKPVDALFLDVRLDDDDAWEILHQLNDHDLPIPPVVLITAEDEKGYAETVFRKFKDEVVDYFVKPFPKKWRERQELCVAKIKARLEEIDAVPDDNKPVARLEISEGSRSRVIPVEKITHVIRIKEKDNEFPLAGLYLYTVDQPEPFYTHQYKALSRLIKKLDPKIFIYGDRSNLINHQFVTGFKNENLQSFALVGPYQLGVILSTEGAKRIREAMGLLSS